MSQWVHQRTSGRQICPSYLSYWRSSGRQICPSYCKPPSPYFPEAGTVWSSFHQPKCSDRHVPVGWSPSKPWVSAFLCLLLKKSMVLISWFHLSPTQLLGYEAMNVCIKAGSGLRAEDIGLIELGKESQLWVCRPVLDESFSSLIGS